MDHVSKACSYDSTVIKLTHEFKEKIKEYESNNWIVQTFRSNILKDQDWLEVNKLLMEDLISFNKKVILERNSSDS